VYSSPEDIFAMPASDNVAAWYRPWGSEVVLAFGEPGSPEKCGRMFAVANSDFRDSASWMSNGKKDIQLAGLV